jgi:hypothetical protein
VSEEIRFDRATLARTWEETPEGYLRVEATFARSGLQRYRRADGTEQIEYRPEEEVSREDSLLSLANLPVTLEHPPELLTPENTREYSRGSTGSIVKYQSPFALGFVTITDREAIDAVKRGDSREVSVGYRVKYDSTPGVTARGERYDGVQRQISGNHVAIVRRGRAGPDVRLRMDSAVAVDPVGGHNPPPETLSEETEMTAVAALSSATEALAGALKDARTDGGRGKRHRTPPPPEEEAGEGEETEEGEEMDGSCGGKDKTKWDSADWVPRAVYETVVAERDTAKADHERDLGRLDALADRLDSLENELDNRTDAGEIDVDALVNQRLTLIDQVATVAGERPTFDGLTDRELMIQALEARSVDPERFDGRSDEYVAAVFETYLDAAAQPRGDAVGVLTEALSGIPAGTAGANAVEAARQQMVATAQQHATEPLFLSKGDA